MVLTACALSNPRQPALAPGKHHSSQPTPRKLNQNPGASTANGSANTTAASASANVDAVPAGRRNNRASNNTPIISRVRTVGKAKPAAAVYSADLQKADSTPA